MFKLKRRVISFCLLFCLLLHGHSAHAIVSNKELKVERYFSEMRSLRKQATLVVRGQVERMRAQIRETEATVRIDEVFQGDETLKTVDVISLSGKVFANPEEPWFTAGADVLLFLEPDPAKPEERYRCVSQSFGMKIIRHKNIYVDAGDAFKNMKLKDYLNEMRKEDE